VIFTIYVMRLSRKFLWNIINWFRGRLQITSHKRTTFLNPPLPLVTIFQKRNNFVFGVSQILIPPPPKAWRNLRTTPYAVLSRIFFWSTPGQPTSNFIPSIILKFPLLFIITCYCCCQKKIPGISPWAVHHKNEKISFVYYFSSWHVIIIITSRLRILEQITQMKIIFFIHDLSLEKSCHLYRHKILRQHVRE